MSDKRTDYLSWDEYFMGVAMLSGMRSKDPNTQVGCCIVSQDNKILSMGYNGLPIGCSDDEFPWARECNFELQWRQSCRSETLRVSFPVQRMCKSYHTVRDQRGDL